MARILIVEDDETFRGILAIELRRRGYEVNETHDGTAATFHLARSFFDVIVTDLRMPGKDGFELMAEIRRDYPSSKIIVMSRVGTDSSWNILEAAKLLGAESALIKPFKLSQLVEAISSVLR